MKKIFLIPLLTLLCTVMAWGVDVARVEGGGLENPQTAANLTELNRILDEDINGTQATVTLLEDIEGFSGANDPNNVTLTIPAEKNVLLNLNGKGIVQHWQTIAPTYKWKDGVTEAQKEEAIRECGSIEQAYSANYQLYPGGPYMYPYRNLIEKVTSGDVDENALIYNLGTLKIISEGNSIIQHMATQTAGNAATICNSGHLTIESGIFIGPTTRWVELGWTVKMPVIWAINDATTIINGGSFLCDEARSDYATGANFGPIHGSGTFQINGGVFSVDEENAAYNDWTKTDPDNTALATPRTTNNPVTADLLANKLGSADVTTIVVPYTNANIPGYGVRGKNQPDSKPYRLAVKPVCVVVPTTGDRLVVNGDNTTNNEYALAADDATFNFVYVEPGKTLRIPDGKKLRVNTNSGIILGGTDAKIVVEAGGTLISDGDIITSTNDNIELTMDGTMKVNPETGEITNEPVDKYSTLLIKPNAIQAKHPNATVTLKSKGYKKSSNMDINDDYVFQRFAVPTYNESIKRGDATVFDYDVATAIYKLTDANEWTVMTKAANEAFKPFRCYDMTVQALSQGAEYVFKGELVGNGNPTLTLYNDKWNYFGNSYTAPIDIAAMINDLDASYTHLRPQVWVHNMGGDTWTSVTLDDVDEGPQEMAVLKVQPMQAFVYCKDAEGANPELDYQSYVYNPFMGIQPNNAPKRKVAKDYTRATMTVEAANGQINTMKLYESENFDASFDNKHNVEKLMNENAFNMYFAFAEGNLERVASDNLSNLAITLETKKETSYTVNFKNVTLEGYALRDNLTGTETEIVNGNTYSFSAPANSKIEGRFEIVAAAHMPTAIEDVEVKANVKGIYSLTGQYLGENFHALPAGVYVINGKKVVK